MIQLKILTGKMAGTTWVARHFPVRIGRSTRADLQLEEPGVWEEHFQITLDVKQGFIVETQPNALATVNGEPTQQSILHNGDLIEIGSLKIQFWLGEAIQRGLKIREGLVWAIIAAVTLGQIALVYWLIR
jgi:pSer/pThr/pTyr-binding forkhead associated (FHA) protein